MPLRASFVELPNEVRLSFYEQGDASGLPVLLLPGLGDSWRSFAPVLVDIPESIRVFALSQRGHGDSGHPPHGYSFNDFAEDLGAFMDAFELERAVIVGHSASGFVGQRFAIDHPERTVGLVFICSPVTLRGHPGLQEAWERTISKLTDPVDPGFVRAIQEGTLARPVPEAFLETLVQEALKVSARVWRAAFESLLEADLSAELHQVEAPTLIIWGDRDTTVSRNHQMALTSAIGSSQFVTYAGAGHSPHWEEPKRFASDLVAFVRGIGG